MHHLGLREFDEPFGLRPRDERSRVDAEGQAVELLDLSDVRHRLAGGSPCHAGAVGRLCVGTDRRVRVGDDRGPVHPDGIAEQQLGVQPRRLGAAGVESLDPLAQQHPDLGHGRDAAIRAGS